MVIAWHPETQWFKTIAPARVAVFGEHRQEATAMLPAAYCTAEIQIIDELLPKGSLLFALSDGVYDNLPQQRTEIQAPEGRCYQETTLDRALMITCLIPIALSSPTHIYMTTILNYALQCFNQRLTKLQTEAIEAKRQFTHLMTQNETMVGQEKKAYHQTLSFWDSKRSIQIGDDATLVGLQLRKR